MKKVSCRNIPGINLVATVYGDDLADKCYREAQGLIADLPEPEGDHRADHGRHRRRRAGRHRRRQDRQGQRHRPRPAVGDGRRTSTAARSKAFAIWNPIDLGYSATHDRLRPRHEEGRRPSPAPRCRCGRDGRGQARRQQRGRDGRPLRLRQDRTSTSSPRSSEIRGVPRAAGAGTPRRRLARSPAYAAATSPCPPAASRRASRCRDAAPGARGISKSFPGVQALDGVDARALSRAR